MNIRITTKLIPDALSGFHLPLHSQNFAQCISTRTAVLPKTAAEAGQVAIEWAVPTYDGIQSGILSNTQVLVESRTDKLSVVHSQQGMLCSSKKTMAQPPATGSTRQGSPDA